MDTQETVILDTWAQDECDSGHIPDAVPLLLGTIEEDTATVVIPEKDSTDLVYCRSGNRSKTVSSILAELEYPNACKLNGTQVWSYETEP